MKVSITLMTAAFWNKLAEVCDMLLKRAECVQVECCEPCHCQNWSAQ